MPELDLNLIPYLVAMEDTRNVSRAAERLGVSQPRVSTALGRLREYFGDPLFVRTSRGMEPTPRALMLIPAAREALSRIESGLIDSGEFDPATSTHTFSIALSDVGEIVFLPRLLQLFAQRAPYANLRSVTLTPAHVERGLESGDVEEALNTATAIGDDRLQKQAQGEVVPDSFTHGTSEQRVRWFKTGSASGQVNSCDTFAAAKL